MTTGASSSQTRLIVLARFSRAAVYVIDFIWTGYCPSRLASTVRLAARGHAAVHRVPMFLPVVGRGFSPPLRTSIRVGAIRVADSPDRSLLTIEPRKHSGFQK